VIDIRHEQAIDASSDEVWARLAQFDHLAQWTDAVDHSSFLTARIEGVGTTRRVQAGSMVLVEEITIWEPRERLAYALHGLPPVVTEAVNDWTIEAAGAGSRVALTAHIAPGPRPPMRIAARILGRRLGSTNARLLADLACAVEGT
jgi:polyketide cyclase/dehydrase/lipid transport protein